MLTVRMAKPYDPVRFNDAVYMGIPLTQLRSTSLVQREPSPARVKKILNNWHWELAKVFVVDAFGMVAAGGLKLSSRKLRGKMWDVIDAGHRLRACMAAFEDGVDPSTGRQILVPCLLSSFPPHRGFVLHNSNMKSPGRDDLFKANYYGKEPADVFVFNRCRAAGIHIVFGRRKTLKPGMTKRGGALRQALDLLQRRSFVHMVHCITSYFNRADDGAPEMDALTSDFIDGFALAISRSQQTFAENEECLQESPLSAADIIKKGRQLATNGYGRAGCVADVILEDVFGETTPPGTLSRQLT